ncbi:MAG TPA: DUF1116 domain-containing protein [Propionibacteriaceae bacterium]|nr:DUF1116 domain-containing protein [Propionibacteriaceae bacterium]
MTEALRPGTIDEANAEIVAAMAAGQPTLIDVVPAHTVISVLAEETKTLLHAGPPLVFVDMPAPMQASCVGAVLFEGWADDEASARRLIAEEIRFVPNHDVNAVGPMGGITSAHMPVVVVENRVGDPSQWNRAYCTMNEGIGKVLRFGAFDKEVIARLGWMRDVLGPSLAAALRLTHDGYPLMPVIARAIAMGDEFHQRNIASSALFAKDFAPLLVRAKLDVDAVAEVTEFLGRTDQFFLNLAMASCKAIMDNARRIPGGSVVTAMTRNGKDFGIRVSGLGDRWFVAPVNTPEGLFFTGYSQDQACPDMGDSAITETYGLGGMSMIAAPAVTRFVGAGGLGDAQAISEEMAEIVVDHNPGLSIPTWDFLGTPTGIDVRKVVETSITPIINTGIASLEPGVGQIGAGTVRAPLGCFTAALEALAEAYGVDLDN